MKALNMPVEMISLCAVDGEIRPLRFRYEDGCHKVHTVSIHEVLVAKELNYVGVESFLYICKALWQEREILFELRYTIKTHCWVLYRLIN